MEHPSLAFALVLALAAGTMAGCIQDLERRQLEATWDPDIQVQETAYLDVHRAVSMVTAEGAVSLPEGANVTVTDLVGQLEGPNATIALEPMRVNTEEGTQRATEAEGSLSLSDGDRFTATFVPDEDGPLRANPDLAWNTSIELQWRFRDGGAFDAGRLEASHNDTPSRVGGLGVGVVERSGGTVDGLVFEAIDIQDPPDSVEVEILRVGGGSAETIDTLDANVTRSDGTVRLAIDEELAVPEGTGYLVFRLADPGGVATTELRASEEPVPGLGAALALATVGLAALGLRRRR